MRLRKSLKPLTELQQHIVYAHHNFKITKQKLVYVNIKMGNSEIDELHEKIVEITGKKQITKTVYYRGLKAIRDNPKTNFYTDKFYALSRIHELTNELEKLQVEERKQYNKIKRSLSYSLSSKHLRILDSVREITREINLLIKKPYLAIYLDV